MLKRSPRPGRFVVLVVLLALTACRTGASEHGPSASALGAHPSGLLKADPPSASSAGAAKATDPGPITLSGQGNEPGRAVSLGDGLTIFRVAHRGSGRFRVTLRDESGQVVDVIAASDGPYDGSYALGLGDPCDCTFTVDAAGP